MKKFIGLLAVGLILTLTGCSSVVATRSTFDIDEMKVADNSQVLNIVEDILREEGMMVSNMEDGGTFKVVKAAEVLEEKQGNSNGEKALNMAMDYLVGYDEFRLFFVLEDSKMYLYGTQRKVKNLIIKKEYSYVDMTEDYGNLSLMKMNRIASKIKERTGLEGRVWNTTGKGLGSEYGVN